MTTITHLPDGRIIFDDGPSQRVFANAADLGVSYALARERIEGLENQLHEAQVQNNLLKKDLEALKP